MTVEPAAAAPYPDEQTDPDVLSLAQMSEELAGAPWQRFAVLGDSIAKGLGESVPGYQDSSWGERLALALRRRQPELEYRNFGEPDLFAAQVRQSQLQRALGFEPDLAALIAGGNDMLRERFDVEAVGAELETMIAALRDAGADVIAFSLLDITKALELPEEFARQLEQRLYALNQKVADLSLEHGLIFVDAATHPRCADRTIYSSDFKHANRRGHALVASITAQRLGWELERRAASSA